MAWHGMAWHGMVWDGMGWDGMGGYGMVGWDGMGRMVLYCIVLDWLVTYIFWQHSSVAVNMIGLSIGRSEGGWFKAT